MRVVVTRPGREEEQALIQMPRAIIDQEPRGKLVFIENVPMAGPGPRRSDDRIAVQLLYVPNGWSFVQEDYQSMEMASGPEGARLSNRVEFVVE